VLIRQNPWGWSAKYRASSSFAPQTWRVNLFGGIKNLTITVGRGLVMGVEPVVKTTNGDVPISGKPAATPAIPPPKFPVPKTAFDPNLNQAGLYLQANMDTTWFITKVTLAAFPSKPPATPFTAFKLIGFFISQAGSINYQQMAWFNLGLGTLFNRTPTGNARYVWYAT